LTALYMLFFLLILQISHYFGSSIWLSYFTCCHNHYCDMFNKK